MLLCSTTVTNYFPSFKGVLISSFLRTSFWLQIECTLTTDFPFPRGPGVSTRQGHHLSQAGPRWLSSQAIILSHCLCNHLPPHASFSLMALFMPGSVPAVPLPALCSRRVGTAYSGSLFWHLQHTGSLSVFPRCVVCLSTLHSQWVMLGLNTFQVGTLVFWVLWTEGKACKKWGLSDLLTSSSSPQTEIKPFLSQSSWKIWSVIPNSLYFLCKIWP